MKGIQRVLTTLLFHVLQFANPCIVSTMTLQKHNDVQLQLRAPQTNTKEKVKVIRQRERSSATDGWICLGA